MLRARFLAAIAGAALSVLAAAPIATADTSPRIIDGALADSGPWAARMLVNGREQCSATIIAPTWILSARHCVQSSGTYTFHIGDLDQTQGTVATGVQIVQSDEADLALIQLDQEVTAEYAPLGTEGVVAVGDTVQVYGWGATCTNKPEIQCQSQFLKVANVSVNSIDCAPGGGVNGRAICANRIDGITAGGDSGGPMFATGPDGNYYQVGVASTSDRSQWTAYQNITYYRDWIASIAGV